MSETSQQRIVPFYGDALIAVQRSDGNIFVHFGRLCDNLGLARASQVRRVQRHEILHHGLVTLAIETEGGLQSVHCLRIDLLPLWMAGLTIETILRHQYARNPTLLRLLCQASYVEKIGQGFDTVFSECDRLGLEHPSMQETELTFMVALVGHDVIGNARIPQNLSQSQLQIITVLMNHSRAMTTQEIVDALSSTAQPRSLRSVQNDLKILTEAKLITRSGQARASTYLLTQS